MKPRPFCPIHGVEMKAIKATASIRYWRCPLAECRESRRELREHADAEF